MSNKQEAIERLAGVSLFSGLSKKSLGHIWGSMKVVKHAPGKNIVTEGRKGLGFHLILSGQVQASREAGGPKIVLGSDAVAKRNPEVTWNLLVQTVQRLRDAQSDTERMTA
jgi:hypothetical protein